jgi:hypothetical protein
MRSSSPLFLSCSGIALYLIAMFATLQLDGGFPAAGRV